MPAGSTQDAHAELSLPQTLNEKDTQVLTTPPTQFMNQVSSEPNLPNRLAVESPLPSTDTSWRPDADGMRSYATAPPKAISIEAANAPETTNTEATTEPTPTSSAITLTESENSLITTTPFLLGLTSMILGTLILLGLSVSAIYQLAEGRRERQRYGVDDNLDQTRDAFAALPQAQPQA